MKNILIIAVNYKNYPTTIQFIKEFNKMNDVQDIADLIIVDNESNPIKAKELHIHANENIKIKETKDNLGYFGGAKHVIENNDFDIDQYDYVIISNNDIEFPQKKFLDKLSKSNFDSNVGCIAPKVIIKGTKLNQNPYMVIKPTKKYIKFNSFFLASYSRMVLRDLLAKIKQKVKRKSNKVTKTGTAIFAPHGSIVILAKNFFKKGGNIDADYFLYGEELSIGYQCLALDLKVIYDDSLMVIHNEHQTTIGKYSRFKYKYQKKAFEYILKKYNDIVLQ